MKFHIEYRYMWDDNTMMNTFSHLNFFFFLNSIMSDMVADDFPDWDVETFARVKQRCLLKAQRMNALPSQDPFATHTWESVSHTFLEHNADAIRTWQAKTCIEEGVIMNPEDYVEVTLKGRTQSHTFSPGQVFSPEDNTYMRNPSVRYVYQTQLDASALVHESDLQQGSYMKKALHPFMNAIEARHGDTIDLGSSPNYFLSNGSLCVYPPGGHFVWHKDRMKSPQKAGTIVGIVGKHLLNSIETGSMHHRLAKYAKRGGGGSEGRVAGSSSSIGLIHMGHFTHRSTMIEKQLLSSHDEGDDSYETLGAGELQLDCLAPNGSDVWRIPVPSDVYIKWVYIPLGVRHRVVCCDSDRWVVKFDVMHGVEGTYWPQAVPRPLPIKRSTERDDTFIPMEMPSAWTQRMQERLKHPKRAYQRSYLKCQAQELVCRAYNEYHMRGGHMPDTSSDDDSDSDSSSDGSESTNCGID
jgi:hypothetical protein